MIEVHTVMRMKGGHLVQHYLMASYLYYHMNLSPMTDAAFDKLCERLLAQYDSIDHPHKYLIDKGELESGTGFYIPENQYPHIIRNPLSIENYFKLCESDQIQALLEPHLLPADVLRPAPRIMRVRRPEPEPEPVAPSRPARIVRTPPSAAPPTRITRSRPKGLS
jgi:hypothetical protein